MPTLETQRVLSGRIPLGPWKPASAGEKLYRRVDVYSPLLSERDSDIVRRHSTSTIQVGSDGASLVGGVEVVDVAGDRTERLANTQTLNIPLELYFKGGTLPTRIPLVRRRVRLVT